MPSPHSCALLFALLLGSCNSQSTQRSEKDLPKARIKLDRYNLPADGRQQAQLTVNVRSGQIPLAAYPLTLQASGCSLAASALQTDAQGMASTAVSSVVPGLCRVVITPAATSPGSDSTTAQKDPNHPALSAQAQIYFQKTEESQHIAGSVFSLLITATDDEGFLNPSFSGLAQLQSSDEAAALPISVAFAQQDAGQRLLTDLTLRSAGAQRIDLFTADRTQLLASTTLQIRPAAPAALRLGLPRSSLQAGEALLSNIELADLYGNRATNTSGTVQLQAFGSAGQIAHTQLCSLTPADGGSTTCALLLPEPQQGNYHLQATFGALSSPKLPFTLLASKSGAPQLRVAALSSPIAGQPLALKVGAYDAYGNPQADFTGSVILSAQHPDVPAALTVDFTPADQGEKRLTPPWRLSKAGSYTLQIAPPPGTVALGGETPVHIQLSPGRRIQLRPLSLPVVDTNPSIDAPLPAAAQRHQVGEDLPLQVGVADLYGNRDAHFVGLVQLTGCLELPCETPLWEALVRFTPSHQGSQILTLAKAHASWPRIGTAYLQATVRGDPAVVAITQPVTVIGGAAAFFTLSTESNSLMAGAPASFTLRGFDNYNNLATSSPGLYFTSSDGNAALPSPLSLPWGTPVQAQLSSVLRAAGQQSLFLHQANAEPAATLTFEIQPAAPARCQLTAPSTLQAGNYVPLMLRITDVYGNLTPSFSGNVLLQSSDPLASLPPQVYFAAQQQGSQYLDRAVLLRTAGAHSLSAQLAGQDHILTLPITVTLGSERLAVARLALEGNLSAGQWADVRLTVSDSYGNLDREFTGSLSLVDDANQLLWQGEVAGGSRLLPRLKRWLVAGVYGLTAKGTTLPLTATRSPLTVTYASPVWLHASPLGTPQVGVAADIMLWAADSYGNRAVDFTGTLALQSSDLRATLPAEITLQASDLGQKRINGALLHRSAGMQRLIALPPTGALSALGTDYLVAAGAQPIARHAIALPGAAALQAGQRYDLHVWIEDLYGNALPHSDTQVNLSSSDPNAAASTTIVIDTLDNPNMRLAAFVQPTRAGTLQLTTTLPNQPGSSFTSHTPVSRHPLITPQLSLPSTPLALIPINAAVHIADSYGNSATDFQGGIGMRAVPTADISPPNLLFAAGDSGPKATTLLFPAAGSYTLQLFAPFSANVSSASQTLVVLDVLAARYLRMQISESTLQAGAAADLHIWVEKANPSNPNLRLLDEAFTGSLQLSASDPCAVFLGSIPDPLLIPMHAHNGGNILLQSALSLRTAGSHSLTLSSNNLTHQPATLPLVVQPASTRFARFTANAPSVAGMPSDLLLSIVDSYGNPIVDFVTPAAPIEIMTSEPNNSLSFTAYFNAEDLGSKRIYPGPTFYTQGLASLTAQGQNLLTHTSTLPVLASAATTYRLALNPPSPQAGSLASLQISALDSYGNMALADSSSLTLTLENGSALFDPNITLQNGSAEQAIRLFTAGPKQFSLRLGSAGPVVASLPFSVAINPARRAEVAFTNAPAAATLPSVAGQLESVMLRIVDPYGNVDNSYSGTLSLACNDPLASLPSTVTLLAGDGGQKLLDGAFMPRLAQITLLTISGADLLPTSQQIAVAPNPAAMIRIATSTSPTAGISVDLHLWTTDVYGNAQANVSGSVQLTSSDLNATLPLPLTLSGTAQGNFLLSSAAVFRTAGPATLSTLLLPANPNDTGLPFTLPVTVGAHPLTYASATPSLGPLALQTVAVNQPTSLTLKVADAYGNLKEDFTGTLRIQTSDANAQLIGGDLYAFSPAHAGLRTLEQGIVFATAGAATLTARALSSPDVLASTTSFQVQTGPPSSFSLTTEPAMAQAGRPFRLKLTAYDASQAIIPNYATYPLFLQGFPTADSNLVQLSMPGGSTLLPALQTTTAGDYNLSVLTLDSNGNRIELAKATVHVSAGDFNQLRLLIPYYKYTFDEAYKGLLMPNALYDVIAAPVDSYGNALDSYSPSLQLLSSVPGILDPNTSNFAYQKNDAKGMRLRQILQPGQISAGMLSLTSAGSQASASTSFKTGYWQKVVTGNGGSHPAFAVTYAGQVKAWGYHFSGSLGLGDFQSRGVDPGTMASRLPYLKFPANLSLVSFGSSAQTVGALFSDGSLRFWGTGMNVNLNNAIDAAASIPAELGSGRSAIQLGVGSDNFCVVLDDQSLSCLGKNWRGQLGVGDTNDRIQPTRVTELGINRSALQVAGGGTFTCTLLDNQQIKCWGRGDTGSLGLGDTEMRSLPAEQWVDLGRGRSAIHVSSNSYTPCAMLDTGYVKCWGNILPYGAFGFSGRGTGPNEMGDNLPYVPVGEGRRILAVAEGGYQEHFIFLDNTVVKSWAISSYVLGIGDGNARGSTPETSGENLPAINFGSGRMITSIASGRGTCALANNDAVKCFGGAGTWGYSGLGNSRAYGTIPTLTGDNIPPAALLEPTPWRPNYLGPLLWLDAQNSNSLTTESSRVALWQDNSYYQNHLQSQNASQPWYIEQDPSNWPTVYFDGASSLTSSGNLPLNGNALFTLAAVMRPGASAAGNQTFLSFGAIAPGSGFVFGLRNTSSGAEYNVSYSGDLHYCGIPSLPQDGPFLFIINRSGVLSNSWTPAVNGLPAPVRIGNSSDSISLASGTLQLGSNAANAAFGSVYFYEILIYPESLSSYDQTRLEGFLARKWGLLNALPASHPFRNTPPTFY